MNKNQKTFRAVEFVLIFMALPLVFYFDLLPVPKIAALLAITAFCLLLLFKDSYKLKILFSKPKGSKTLARLLMKTGVVALVLIVLVLLIRPDGLFSFPRQQPVVWVIVMLLYPILSALPQEFLYREYFFHRYKSLFKTDRFMVLASAVSFSFLHIIYDNEWAILLSLAGGIMFARTYRQSRSLYWVSLEHALYGCLVFTIGMGNYFYEGM